MAENDIQPHSHSDLPSESVELLLVNQTKDLEIRAEELSLKKQEDDNGFKFGVIALEAKTKDRAECRVHERKKTRDRYIFSGLIIIVLVIAIMTALLNGHKDVAMELIKAIIYLSAGALGGWGAAKKKMPTPEDDSR